MRGQCRICIDFSVIPSGYRINEKGRRYPIKYDYSKSEGLILPYICDDTSGTLEVLSYDNNTDDMLVKHELGVFTIPKVSTSNSYKYLPMAISSPKLSERLYNKEDAWKYTRSSKSKVYFKCPICNNAVQRTIVNEYNNIIVDNIGFSCPHCGDGFSFPFKLTFNMIRQLQDYYDIVDLIHEKSFDWCKFVLSNGQQRYGRYDIYFKYKNNEYVVETDGEFHIKDNKRNGQTKEISKEIDDNKDRLAIENNIKIIRIPSYESIFEKIQDNILNSDLGNIFDLSVVDWNQCRERTCIPWTFEAAELWNSGIHSTEEIGKIMGHARHTVREWLIQLTRIGYCDYSKRKALDYKHEKNKVLAWNKQRSVINLTTNQIWEKSSDCGKYYNLETGYINHICYNHKMLYGYEKEPSCLMFLDEYTDKGNVYQYIIDRDAGFIGNPKHGWEKSKCVCLNTGEKFFTANDAAKYYNIPVNTIRSICNNVTKRAKTGHSFMYYEDYLNATEEDIYQRLYSDVTNSQKIICENTLTIYNSCNMAAELLGYMNKVTLNKKVNRKRSNNYIFNPYTNEKELWTKLDDYLKMHPEITNKIDFIKEHLYIEHEAA